MRFGSLAFVFFCVVSTCGFAAEGEWGHLEGRFLLKGAPPPQRVIQAAKDREAFPNPIPIESLIVNKKNSGVANVLVYLLPEKNAKLKVHSSYEKNAKAKVTLTMKQGRLSPHILLLRTSQIMTQRNADSVAHNLKIDFFANAPM